jgi:hypothetical protein
MPSIGDAFALLGKLIEFMITLPARIANLVVGTTNILIGIGLSAMHLGEIVPMVFLDWLMILGYMFEFVKTYTVCSVYFLTNIKNCILYYVIEMFGVLLYMPIRIMLLIFKLFGVNLYPLEKKVWESLDKLDRYVVGNLGFHIIYWPKAIRNQCFNCKRLKIDILMQRAGDVGDDFFVKIPALIKNAIPLFITGANELGNIFASGSPPMPGPISVQF